MRSSIPVDKTVPAPACTSQECKAEVTMAVAFVRKRLGVAVFSVETGILSFAEQLEHDVSVTTAIV